MKKLQDYFNWVVSSCKTSIVGTAASSANAR